MSKKNRIKYHAKSPRAQINSQGLVWFVGGLRVDGRRLDNDSEKYHAEWRGGAGGAGKQMRVGCGFCLIDVMGYNF